MSVCDAEDSGDQWSRVWFPVVLVELWVWGRELAELSLSLGWRMQWAVGLEGVCSSAVSDV